MIPVGPVIPGAGDVEKVLAENQKEYLPLPTFRTQLTTISRWRLSDEERAYITAGGDLFLAQLNFGDRIQPLLPLALSEDEVLPAVLACEEELQRKAREQE